MIIELMESNSRQFQWFDCMNYRIVMLLDNPFMPDLRVLREARTLAQAGYQITIIAWDRDQKERPRMENYDGIQVIRIPVKSGRQMGFRQIWFFSKFAWQAFKLVMRGECDAVHCHDYLNLPVGVALKYIKRIRLVYDAHEIYWIMESERYSRSVSAFIRRSELFLLKAVDAFITVGRTRAAYYQQHGYRGDIYIVGNWYDPSNLDPVKGSALRQQLEIPKDAFVLVQAGTLAPGRAMGVLLESARQLKDTHPSIHWIIAGAGPSQPEVEQEAAQNPNVHFLGWVDDLTPVFSASDAFIYLMNLKHAYSQYNAPNTLYLSISRALPMIGVAAGEIKDIFRNEETALLLDQITPEAVIAAVIRLSSDAGLYQKLIDGLKSLQAIYTWDAAKRRLQDVYETIGNLPH